MPEHNTPGQTTGSAHFLEAERLLKLAVRAESDPAIETPATQAHAARLIARAQVHATLALASIQAAPDGRRALGYGWHDMANPGAHGLRQL